MSSSLAQKLCDEIVEPLPVHQYSQIEPDLLECSDQSSQIGQVRSESLQCTSQPKKQHAKAGKTFTVEKRKLIQKLVPSSSRSSRAAVNKLMSKEILIRKRFRDCSVNTCNPGPIRCDNESITLVRKKDNRKNCKCSSKHPVHIKETQTYCKSDFSYIDKACDQSILTLNRSTQFIPGLSGVKCVGISTSTPLCNPLTISQEAPRVRMALASRETHKYSNSNFMGARRWSISRYPNRGPDF